MRAFVFLLGALVLAGCDKLTGAADQKIADAEAVGFACRVAQKQPEACMKENEALSPSSLLDGWKAADEDIKAGKLDPGMSNVASEHKEGEPAAEGEKKPEEAKDGEKPADSAEHKDGADKKDGKPAEEKKDAAHEADAAKKPADAAHDKPAH
jgi:hypothetical protein